MKGCTGGDTDRDPFLLCQKFCSCKGIFINDREDLVIHFRVQNIRDETGADTLDLMCTGFPFREDRGAGRFHCNNFHRRILFFQIFTCSGHCAAGPDAGDEDIDFSVCVFPDLRACGGFVDRRVSRIDELSRDKAVGDLCCQFIRFGDGTFHAFGPVCQHDLGPVSLQNIAAFYAHGLRHGQDNAVSFGCGDRCQTNPGVAGSRFNDHRTCFEQTFCFCILDHRFRDAVFHAAGRIEIFQFDQYSRIQIQFLFQVNDFNQRRIADQSQCTFINIRHNIPSFFPVSNDHLPAAADQKFIRLC